MKKKLLSLILALVMLLSLLPTTALADGNVAKIGTTEYATLQAAVDAAANGDVIELIANVEEDVSVSGKAVYIKSGEFGYGDVDAECFVESEAYDKLYGDVDKAVSIVNSNKSDFVSNPMGTGNTIYFHGLKNITLDSDIVLPFYGNTNSTLYFNRFDGLQEPVTLDLNGYKISQGQGNPGGYWFGTVRSELANVIIKDSSQAQEGTIEGIGSCVVVYGYTGYPASITLESGTLSMLGDTPNNGNGIVQTQYAGSFTMTGGTIDGSKVTGDNKARGVFELVKPDDTWGRPEISITGGSIKCVAADNKDSHSSGYSSPDGFLFNRNDGTKPTVTGGYYDFNPSAYVATGYEAVELKEGDEGYTAGYRYKVQEKTPVAQIGDTKYTSLADAIADVPTDGTKTTITMIGDETLADNANMTIAAGQNIVLDLNGKTVTGKNLNVSKWAMLTNNGTLEITDTSGAKNGKITSSTTPETDGFAGHYTVLNKNVMTLTAGTIEETSKEVGGGKNLKWALRNEASENQTVSLTINGGTVIGEYNAVSNYVYNDTSTCSFTVTGGSIITTGRFSPMTMQIANGTAPNANITISGGEFIVQNTRNTNQNGNAIVYCDDQSNSVTDCSNLKFNVTNGKFNTFNTAMLVQFNGFRSETVKPTSYITGGLFKVAPQNDEIATGYVCTSNTDTATKEDYPYIVKPAEVIVEKTEVDADGDITVGSEKITVDGLDQSNPDTIVEAINDTLANPEVTNFTNTGIEEATPAIVKVEEKVDGFDLSKVLNAVKEAAKNPEKNLAQTDGTAVDSNAKASANNQITISEKTITDTDVSKKITVDLTAAAVETVSGASNTTVTSMTFEVKPVATITVTDGDGEPVTVTAKIPNDAITAPITFRLPVDSSVTETWAAVYHEGTFMGNYEIKTENGKKYIEVSSMEFSEFKYVLFSSESAEAEIGTTPYQTLAEAVADVQNGETIVLLNNVDTTTIKVNRNIHFIINNDSKTNNATITPDAGYSMKVAVTEGTAEYYVSNITISAAAGEHGSVAPSTQNPYYWFNGNVSCTISGSTLNVVNTASGSIKYTATPIEGYELGGWMYSINGVSKGYLSPSTMISAADINGNIVFTASFEETKTVSGGGSSYTVTVNDAKNGTFTVDKKNASSGSTVTITVTPDKGFTLETLTVTDKNGKEIEVKNLGNNKFSFKMPSGKVTVKATFMEDNTMLNFFVDVKATDYFYDAVLWAAENGITKGTDAVHFSPSMGTTRAQVVTFLWRAAGCPEPTVDASKFVDVKADSYYEKAVAWAVEQGITTGVTAAEFKPDDICKRGQIVSFLYRYAKGKAVGVNPFNDVKADAYYYDAVLWAVENGVTGGTTATTFSPANTCTRAQVVTFLWRYMGD